jgi:GntR family transcriptional regulator
LDDGRGVPAYRQIIDQVTAGIARGLLKPGDQLPTVRQLAVDLSINPNTVIRAYRELEIRGLLETEQGTGTFVAQGKPESRDGERERRLTQLLNDFLARVGAEGFTLEEAIAHLQDLQPSGTKKRR